MNLLLDAGPLRLLCSCPVSCLVCVCALVPHARVCVCVCRRAFCFCSPQSLAFLVFPPWLSWWVLLGDVDVPFLSERSIDIYSWHRQLWVSVLTAIHCVKKLLWLTILIYGCKNRNFEDILILCPFSRITVVHHPWDLWAPKPWLLTRIRIWLRKIAP